MIIIVHHNNCYLFLENLVLTLCIFKRNIIEILLYYSITDIKISRI